MVTRRTFLRSLGVCIALPLFESAYPEKQARAQAAGGAPKKRFIGCFFGSGAPMPDAANGDWRYGAALQPLQDLGVSGNVSVLRGFRAVNKFDVHWSGTASFLSSQEISMSNASNPFIDPNYQRCAKSFDQFIADTAPGSRIRSLHAGFSQLAGWDDAHDRTVSINYVNSIAWRDDRTPISNISVPAQMFTQVFGAGGSVSNAQAQYIIKRRQSILDGVLDQYKHHKGRLSSEDQSKLEAYAQSIREVEGELSNAAAGTSCARPSPEAGSDAYIRDFRTMHKIIIAAMQCDLTAPRPSCTTTASAPTSRRRGSRRSSTTRRTTTGGRSCRSTGCRSSSGASSSQGSARRTSSARR